MTAKQQPTSADSNADISDARLVDYVLRLLPESANQTIIQALEHSPALQQRLAAWEQVLFQLNRDTPALAPPARVWQSIENRCFTETVTPPTIAWWRRWQRFAVPVVLAVAMLWVGSVALNQRPTYAGVVAAKAAEPMWEIKGNADNIVFVSLKDISMPGMHCVAWVQRDGVAPVLLGQVPDTGQQMSKKITLPDNLPLQAGDRITIGMIKNGAVNVLPETSMMPITVVLTTI